MIYVRMKNQATVYGETVERGAIRQFPPHVAEALIREGEAERFPEHESPARSSGVSYAASLPHSVRS